jgi:hypothetical protein
MKSFVIFPSLCFFIFALVIFKTLELPKRTRNRYILALILTIVFSVTMALNSRDMFLLLYFGNFTSLIVIIPSLIYLLTSNLSKETNKNYNLNFILISLLVVVVTIIVFCATFFFSMANHPMDPGPK